ncbi:MAG: hypothetical protein MJZ05_13860 [Fibrobacter sp.]|nr:hypothetical protein [Fibrobacter sp.]
MAYDEGGNRIWTGFKGAGIDYEMAEMPELLLAGLWQASLEESAIVQIRLVRNFTIFLTKN